MLKPATATLFAVLLALALSACQPAATERAASQDAIVLAVEPGLSEVQVLSHPGETLEAIAAREGIDPARLRAWNPRAPHGLLPAGTRLKAWKVLPGMTTHPAS